ncbi:unnamed protein product [Phytophthora lilii]|uniref:Unnamed protein product n=1 Tax=Phytophthora lilii TaxID=2077276 RepID=A0A9W6TQV9_9STRA|nr:unnamed protein product [Phytophthora lilii]
MMKTNTFELQVILQNGANFSCENPSETVCIEFADCGNWQAAKSVSWRNLPAQWSVDFYQSIGCSVLLDWQASGRWYPQVLNSANLPSVRSRQCSETRRHVVVMGNGTELTVVGSDVDDDIPLNWFESPELEDLGGQSGSDLEEYEMLPDALMNG